MNSSLLFLILSVIPAITCEITLPVSHGMLYRTEKALRDAVDELTGKDMDSACSLKQLTNNVRKGKAVQSIKVDFPPPELDATVAGLLQLVYKRSSLANCKKGKSCTSNSNEGTTQAAEYLLDMEGLDAWEDEGGEVFSTTSVANQESAQVGAHGKTIKGMSNEKISPKDIVSDAVSAGDAENHVRGSVVDDDNDNDDDDGKDVKIKPDIVPGDHRAHSKEEHERDESEARIDAEVDPDLLYEGAEHMSTDARLGGLKVKLGNGLRIPYGVLVALAGDFYGNSVCPVSTGNIRGAVAKWFAKGSLSLKETVKKRLYEHCGWTYSPPLGEICPSDDESSYVATSAAQSPAARRFLHAFESLWYADGREFTKIHAIKTKELRSLRGPGHKFAPMDYFALGDSLVFKHTEVTGGRIVAGKIPLGGRYLALAQVNWDHFLPWSQIVYEAAHGAALREAVSAAIENRPIDKALAMNSYADHFLTDMFSAGHLRNPRRQLHDLTFLGTNMLPFGDLLSRQMHDEQNLLGLNLESKAGGKWRAYGDKMYFTDANSDNRNRCQNAVESSVEEVHKAFREKALPKSRMDAHFTRASDDNYGPMFKVINGGKIAVREEPGDIECTKYTTDFNAPLLFKETEDIKARRVARWKFDHAKEFPSDPIHGARRLHEAIDGTGTNEGVINEVLFFTASKDMRALRTKFRRLAGKTLVRALEKDTSGGYENAVVACAKRDAGKARSASDAADAIYSAFKGFATDEAKAALALCEAGPTETKKIVAAFGRRKGKSLEEWIRKETSGHTEDFMLSMIGIFD